MGSAKLEMAVNIVWRHTRRVVREFNMRISKHQAVTIKHLVKQVFGQNSEVYLFGSRAQDNMKGGDIDLYIKPSEQSDIFQKKIRLASQLQMALGEQKFDIVLAQYPERLIEQQAIATGIRL